MNGAIDGSMNSYMNGSINGSIDVKIVLSTLNHSFHRPNGGDE